ncbi:aspartate racemase [Desulfitobacterium sp. LBE]|uniref:aspartate/glutamate racemase family protein n=1 Tax=Desulfitobacterium sp. LBE TaxID=884086 RepID=UPI00119948F7|nr:amino acid racemase [Desulfitobacterium sp. LBE]TWH56731.1 aspartate racemase [Desulfitobacterium sp. LBE]
MKKKIGILGGISHTSTIKYYQTLMNLYYERFGNYYYPEIIMHSLDFQYFTDLENELRLQEYEDYIVYSMHCLEKAGADFIIMAANSPHSVLAEVRKRIGTPILSIVDAVGRAAQKKNVQRLLLTGIKYTMQSDFYRNGMRNYGIEIITPNDEEQNLIDQIIFKELVLNTILDKSREDFLAIINRYPVDGVILGCTELPLLLSDKDAKILLLNSLHLHCEMALNYTLGDSTKT